MKMLLLDNRLTFFLHYFCMFYSYAFLQEKKDAQQCRRTNVFQMPVHGRRTQRMIIMMMPTMTNSIRFDLSCYCKPPSIHPYKQTEKQHKKYLSARTSACPKCLCVGKKKKSIFVIKFLVLSKTNNKKVKCIKI